MNDENKDNKEYGLFNGRRSADQYVKGYLRGVMIISGVTLAIGVSVAGWMCLQIINHDQRLTKIESNRFTNQDAMGLNNDVVDIKILYAAVKSELTAINRDLAEIKEILKRTSPYERNAK